MRKGRIALALGLMLAVSAGTYALLLRLDPLGPAQVEPTAIPAPRLPLPLFPAIEESPTEAAAAEEPAPVADQPLPTSPLPRRPESRTRTKAETKAESKPETTTPSAVLTIRDTTPPELRVLEPEDRFLARQAVIPIRVRAEAGGRAQVGEEELDEQAGGLFVGSLRLARGPNHFVIRAIDAVGNTSEQLLRVTFVEPIVERSRKRIGFLLGQITEIKTLAADLDRQSAELVARIHSSDDAELINKLSADLRGLRSSRKELESAIDKSMDDLDHLAAEENSR